MSSASEHFSVSTPPFIDPKIEIVNHMTSFADEVTARISAMSQNAPLRAAAGAFMKLSADALYSYNFGWLGRPIIQWPQDIVAMQELIWSVKPDLIIETGIAHGGSLIFSASMLAMLDYCDAVAAGKTLDPKASRRKVIGIDIDIRAHNRAALEAHPLIHKIELIQGSSIDAAIVERVALQAQSYDRVMVCLDSNHTHAHVLAELNAYAPLTTKNSYCVVFDTMIEDFPAGSYPNRPWDVGNNPKTAVHAYLSAHPEFEIDRSIDNKLQISVAPDGYLKKIR